MSYVIAASRPGYDQMRRRLSKRFRAKVFLFTSKKELSLKRLVKIRPKWIFFPHWSYIVPAEIYENYPCIIFHMTDLPFGRGGTPLQNLIVRGFKWTKISALKCTKGIDAGPIYLKRPLSLKGTAQEIYLRAGQIIEEMIKMIILKHPLPIPQKGKVVIFHRRKPQDGDLGKVAGLRQLYDMIRMLDAEGYPRAFLENRGLKYEFSSAVLKKNKLQAMVTVTSIKK